MSDRYLWDKSGPRDPEVEKLERSLKSLAQDGRPLEMPPVHVELQRPEVVVEPVPDVLEHRADDRLAIGGEAGRQVDGQNQFGTSHRVAFGYGPAGRTGVGSYQSATAKQMGTVSNEPVHGSRCCRRGTPRPFIRQGR